MAVEREQAVRLLRELERDRRDASHLDAIDRGAMHVPIVILTVLHQRGFIIVRKCGRGYAAELTKAGRAFLAEVTLRNQRHG